MNSPWRSGALALADRGVYCIGEFRCVLQDNRASIYKAMEQQTILLTKASIICKLNVRTTVMGKS